MLAVTSTDLRDEGVAPFTPNPGFSLTVSRALVLLGLIAQVFVAFRFWHITWDDSAITVGFARVFAATGRIEPTPGSGIVEGYSTTLWMLLLSFAAKFIRNPASLLAFAKIATLVLNLANILLIRRWLRTWNAEVVANLAAGAMAFTCMYYETINGMETPLLLFLLFVLLLLRSKRDLPSRLAYVVTGCAFAVVRFETVWFLIPLLLCESEGAMVFAPAFTWASVLVASCAVRFHYFGYLMPNTVYAKHGLPYIGSDRSGELLRHLSEPWDLFLFVAPLLMLLAIAAIAQGKRFRKTLWARISSCSRTSPTSLSGIFVVFALLLITAIGKNWGPPLRAFYPAWPFLFVLLFRGVATAESPKILGWSTIAICLFCFAHTGLAFRDMSRSDAPVYMKDTSVDHFSRMYAVLRHIQNVSRDRALVFAGPDMGAVMLYSTDVRVVDLGLLCDPVLAHRRYAAIESYVLRERHPDVIEVHRMWDELSGLPDTTYFYANYQPVYVSGTRVFISNSRLAQMDHSHLRRYALDRSGKPQPFPTDETPYVTYRETDFRMNRGFGLYYVLD